MTPKQKSRKVKKEIRNRCSLFPVKREDVLTLQDVRQQSGWSITAFDLPIAWKHTQGEGVKVAVLDSGCDLDHPDLVGNLLPGKNFINPKKPPKDDNQHGCVHPSSIIQTNFCGIETIKKLYARLPIEEQLQHFSDGYISKLKDISSMGIKTISFNMNEKKTVVDTVTHIHKMPIKANLVCIELEGGIKLQLTPWHPIIVSQLTKGRRSIFVKKKANELNTNDRLVPSNTPISLSKEFFRVYYKMWLCEHCGHIPKCKVPKSKCKKCGHQEWIISNEFINEKLAYICGMVLTDGHVVHGRNYRVEITNTENKILKKIKELLLDMGIKSKIDHPSNRCSRLLVNSKRLVLLLEAIGIKSGCKTYDQKLPEFVGKSPITVIYAFLAGVIDGDGCVSKTNTGNRITTVSRDFAQNLCALLNGIAISSSIVKYKNKFKGKINVDFPILNVVFGKIPLEIAEWIVSPKKKKRILINQKHNKRSVRRIKKITREWFDGEFYDFTTKNTNNYIANGHFVSNTHVTGIICAQNNDIGVVGVAPKSKVIPIKVLDKQGSGSLTTVAKGIRWAVDVAKADIITMSLGSPGRIQEVRKAIQYAAKRGVPTFVAAGNAGDTEEVFYPAAYPETIAIGSISQNFNRSKFSNTGKNLDFMAPGHKILSTVPDNWYAILSGTSMACPFVAGIAALLLSYTRRHKLKISLKTVENYRQLFREHTIPVSNKKIADKKFYQGFGIIDPRRFIKRLEEGNLSG